MDAIGGVGGIRLGVLNAQKVNLRPLPGPSQKKSSLTTTNLNLHRPIRCLSEDIPRVYRFIRGRIIQQHARCVPLDRLVVL